MQEDFGESLMPGILGQFTRHHPQVRIVARVDRNGPLRQALAEETLDLALLWQTEDQGPGLGRCSLAWIAHPDFDVRALLASGEPLPLVMFDSPCLMRSRAIACLDAAGIPWQVVFVSHSLSGIWAAVQAGLGLTVRTRIGMPGNLRPMRRPAAIPWQFGRQSATNPASGNPFRRGRAARRTDDRGPTGVG